MKANDDFDSFIGQPIIVQEGEYERKGVKYPNPSIAQGDPTLAALRGACEAIGLSLRVWLPNTVGTMDFNLRRLNVHIEKGVDGVYRIARANLG